jgi:hypothetical protein
LGRARAGTGALAPTSGAAGDLPGDEAHGGAE